MIDDVLICSAVAPETEDGSERVFDPAWWTELVVDLSKLIVLDLRFDLMPALADELEEAGCDDGMVLRHCRECEVHKSKCWVLGLTLNRSASTRASELGELSEEKRQSLHNRVQAKRKAAAKRSISWIGHVIDYFWWYVIGAVINFIIFLFVVAALKSAS